MIDYLKDKSKFKPAKASSRREAKDGGSQAKDPSSDESKQDQPFIAPKTSSELDMQYRDLSGVTMNKLSWGMWFVENKSGLISAGKMTVMVMATACWLYFVYSFGLYVAKGMKDDSDSLRSIIENNIPGHGYFQGLQAKGIVLSPVQVFAHASGKYDFLLRAQNPNSDIHAYLDYHFSASGKDFGHGREFMLPGQSKHLSLLGVSLDSYPGSPSFNIDRVSWERVEPHKYGAWKEYLDARTAGISVSDIKFTPPSSSFFSSENSSAGNLSFLVTNRTPFNYYKAGFTILFRSAGSISGVYKYTLDNLYSGTERQIDMSLAGMTHSASNVEVIPDIDILDESNYMKF